MPRPINLKVLDSGYRPSSSLDTLEEEDDEEEVNERVAFLSHHDTHPASPFSSSSSSSNSVRLGVARKETPDGDDDDEFWDSRRVPLGVRVWTRGMRELYKNNVGLLLLVLSQLFGACMNIAVKFLNQLDPPVPPFELVIVRMMFTLVFSVSYMHFQSVPHPLLGPPGVRRLLVFRGVSGFFGLFGMYYSLQYLSLSDAVVLTFLIPTSTAVAAYFMLGEGFTRGQAIAGLSSLIGVVLIARPEFLFGAHAGLAGGVPSVSGVDAVEAVVSPSERGTPAQRLGAVGVALMGVLGATGAVTTLRAIGTRAHTLHSITYFACYSILVGLIGMIVFQIPPVVPQQWKWVALFFVIGFCGYGAQVTLTLGLQRETASRGMLAQYTQIVFASILERIFLDVRPSLLSMLGTGIIISSAIYVALTKRAPSKEPKTRIVDAEARGDETPLALEDIQKVSKA